MANEFMARNGLISLSTVTTSNSGINIGTSTTSIISDGSSIFIKASGNTYLNTANSVYVGSDGSAYVSGSITSGSVYVGGSIGITYAGNSNTSMYVYGGLFYINALSTTTISVGGGPGSVQNNLAVPNGSLYVNTTLNIGTYDVTAPFNGLTPVATMSKSGGFVLDLRNGNTSIVSGDTIGAIQFSGKSDSSIGYTNAQIKVLVTSNPGTGSSGTSEIVFYANPGGGGSQPTERARITANGVSTTQFTSTIATGTAPFVVTSTTPVTNLSIGGNAATVTTVTSTQVTGAFLAGYVVSTNTALSASDTVLVAFNKIQGQINSRILLTSAITGYAVSTNTALAATDTVLGAFNKIQGQINSRILLTSAITGYVVSTNTALVATDTVLGAFNKIQGQINARALSSSLSSYLLLTGGTLSGSITISTASSSLMTFTVSANGGRSAAVGINDGANMYYPSCNGGNLYLGSGTTNNINGVVSVNSTVTATNFLSPIAQFNVNGSSNDPYGAVSVTNTGTTSNWSYFGMTRAGQIGTGIGITADNKMWFGSSTSGGASSVASAFWLTMNGSNATFSGTVTATDFLGNWNGYTYSASGGGNTMVQRDSNGYIVTTYFYTSGGGSERNTTGMSYFAGFNSSDYYIRSYTPAAVAAAIGAATGTGLSNYVVKWSGTNTVTYSSAIYDDASQAGISSPIIRLSSSQIFIGLSGSSTTTIGDFDGGGTTAIIAVNGTLRVKQDVIAYYSSDKRLKDNVVPITNALDKISKIGGYEFDWNNNQNTYTGHDIGVIAQEIEEVLPELVIDRENGYKAVKYEKIVALLIEGMKDQQKLIENQQIQIDSLLNK